MDFYQVSLGLVFLFNLSLAIFVLSKNFRAGINRTFCLFSAGMALWGFGAFILSIAPNKSYAMASLWFLHTGLIVALPSFFHFVLTLTKNRSQFNKRFSIFAYGVNFFLLVLDRTGIMALDKDVVYENGLYFPSVGPASFIFIPFFLILLSYGIYLLYQAYKTSTSPLEKSRYKYLFLGMAVLLLFATTNILRVMGI
ncbi:hypothetical protein KKC52_00415, partial [bacterium]|nr:hypothetical protein [bacterium]